MEVRTIRPKPPKRKDGEVAQGLAAGVAGYPHAGVKKINEDVAAGVAPEEAGYLPYRVGKGVKVDGLLLPSDDEIEWAKMDANAELDFGKGKSKQAKRKSPWHYNYQEASRESRRTGKPLLIWFTRSGTPGSPMCARLKRELYGDLDFAKWADEKLIRLKVDASGGDRQTDEFGQLSKNLVARRKYAESLKKRFRVMGQPTLVMVQPDGGVYFQERGYSRGEKKELWGKMKNAVLTIEHNREVWERKMAAKGYRRWTGQNGEVVFAKLTRYHNGNLLLTEPDGHQIKTSQKDLSKDDRGWIVAEKKKRGL
jgi:thioredoxin-related protein